MDETWLTVAECAAEVSVSGMTIYRLIHNGVLPATRVGRSFRVAEQDWRNYLQEARV